MSAEIADIGGGRGHKASPDALAEAVATLGARYHDEIAPGGDMTDHSRSIELEVEVPGTAEQVWAGGGNGPRHQ